MKEKINIKLINKAYLEKNKITLINLLEDNLKINFPKKKNLNRFAISGYEDMVRFEQDNTAILIGAFEEDSIIGFLWAYPRYVLGEKKMHIGHIVVNSSVRSGGIGSGLLKYLEDLCRIKGIKKIDLMTTIGNENTLKFYNSKGFSKERVLLEKELGEIDDNR